MVLAEPTAIHVPLPYATPCADAVLSEAHVSPSAEVKMPW
jgi:hypothetical protein